MDKKEIVSWVATVAEAITALAPIVKYVLVAAGTLFVASLIVTPAPSNLDEFRAEYAVYRQQAASAIHFKDSITVVVNELELQARASEMTAYAAKERVKVIEASRPSNAVVATMQAEIDSLTKVLTDSVTMARVIIPKQQAIIDTQKVIIQSDSLIKENNKITISEFAETIGTLRRSNSLLMVSNDSLTKITLKMPDTPKDEKFLWVFPMPTRTQALVIGTVGGIVITTATISAIHD